MKWLRQLAAFWRGLWRTPSPSGRVDDTDEMELEIERRRGMRGF
jgi:hypothetical protein